MQSRRVIPREEMFRRFRNITEQICEMASYLDSRKFEAIERELKQFKDFMTEGLLPSVRRPSEHVEVSSSGDIRDSGDSGDSIGDSGDGDTVTVVTVTSRLKVLATS